MSCPAMSLYFPSRRKPVNRAITSLGLAARSRCGCRPSASSTPGRKGSINTSTCLRTSFRRVMAAGDFRSRAIEDFRRARRSDVGGGGLDV